MARTPDADGSRAHRSGLTRQDVLTAALRLIDADGVDALSMRRLGRAGGLLADGGRLAGRAPANRPLRLGLHHLPAREFPRLRSLATELAAYDGAQELEEGLDVVLSGLRRLLDASGRRDTSTDARVPS